MLGIVLRKHEGRGGSVRQKKMECPRGTLTAHYAMFSVQCSVQNTVQCTLYSAVFDKKYMHVGCPCTHWVVTSQPVKTKLAKYSHV